MSYTPHTITENKLFYSIPIYQRLFEWDTDNIVTLLEDLKKAFELSDGKDDYYIECSPRPKTMNLWMDSSDLL